MPHKCSRCHVETKKYGTLYLMKHQIIDHKRVETGVPFHVEICPKCDKAELFKVK